MSIVNPHDPGTWPLGYQRPTPPDDSSQWTTEQREALHRVYLRTPLSPTAHALEGHPGQRRMSWDTFSRSASLSRDGSLMVYWCGMWLGIEPDGHTHS